MKTTLALKLAPSGLLLSGYNKNSSRNIMSRILLSLLLLLSFSQAKENLASWNDGKSKNDIIAYVTSVADPKSPDFIPVKDRIAVFDNDGTLWSEQPMYFFLYFVMDKVKAIASQHPEWKITEPFKSAL